MKIKRVIALLLVIAMISALASCVQPEGGETGGENLDGKVDYKVTVLDPFGNPMPQMVVKIFNGEEQIEMKLTNNEGVVTPKNPLVGDSFTVEVESTKGDKLAYDESLCILKDGEEEITIVVYNSVEDLFTVDIYPQSSETGEPVEASVLNGSGYMVDLVKGENYFVFYPTMRGVYTASVTSSADVSIEYRGGPHYVFATNCASDDVNSDVFMSGGSVCFNIRSFNVGAGYEESSKYVLMINSSADAKGVITFGYAEDLSESLQELPWSEYILPQAPQSYVVPEKGEEGFALTDFDITSKTQTVVYNNADGYYHVGSVDGPVLLLRVTSASKYLPSLQSISETDPFAVYVYDDDGNFVKKIIYQGMLDQYCAAADPDYGVVPLDAHLLEAITNYGKASTHGWFTTGGGSSIFGEDQANVNPALAVYFACCYYAG